MRIEQKFDLVSNISYFTYPRYHMLSTLVNKFFEPEEYFFCRIIITVLNILNTHLLYCLQYHCLTLLYLPN